ncbi:5'-nucleotidase sure [Anaeramoeba ignava]|uniref:5'-nucleotidase sure n=1 Tax=Anaeramoeba ignava TaxID=1746090 RepID=A0A9Q0R5J3_ANAIG|nr:5'-nucleotidase sure [Anaeramoeba ignava]
MNSQLNIFITNDDGYESPTIATFIRALLSKNHKVYCCLPDQNWSWSTKIIKSKKTTAKKIRYKLSPNSFYEIWIVNGPPANCVQIGLLHLFKNIKFDLVISGPNTGSNYGTFALSSGTIGAAIEACNLGFRSVALSYHTPNFDDFDDMNAELESKLFPTAKTSLSAIEQIFLQWPLNQENVFFNVNIPVHSKENPISVYYCVPFNQTYGSLFEENNSENFENEHSSFPQKLIDSNQNEVEKTFDFSFDKNWVFPPLDEIPPKSDLYGLLTGYGTVTLYSSCLHHFNSAFVFDQLNLNLDQKEN